MNNLPLIDGAFLIDNSAIEKLKCPRCFQYNQLYSKVAANAKAAPNFGQGVHRGLETRYKLVGTSLVDKPTSALIVSAMQQHFDENPQPASDFRDFGHACKVVDVYNHIYKTESFEILKNHEGKPVIEASFMLPFAIKLPNDNEVIPWENQAIEKITEYGWMPIYYCGKIDLGIRDYNAIWSFDHKTAFQYGDSWEAQMAVDGGQRGYVWALEQILGQKVAGYIIDGIRIRRPRVKDEFTGEASVDGTDFKRKPVYTPPEDIEEWKNDTLAILGDIFHYAERGYFPKHRWQCVGKYGICEYYDVCSMPESQRDTVLNSNLFEPNIWTKGLKTK